MSLPEDDRIDPPARDDSDLPGTEPDDDSARDEAEELRSLQDDVEALIEDGRTYLEAELAYQRTRAAFIVDRGKSAAFFGVIAAGCGFVALIALTVGLIFALTPLLTAWGASALVVTLLIAGGLLAARAASRRWSLVVSAIDTNTNPNNGRRQ